ncbi:hypothetical protein NFI95_07835 [Acetobacteraceae bacterium KSS8]|uniref:Uncharacterized protein n=1 Tax=Endosaccharibacter trunci TaxID=2812733 RepID=A0ABT1W651_9PROT|nr:hypothetical protein [Acetobacteraceae bacterium KSS8]
MRSRPVSRILPVVAAATILLAGTAMAATPIPSADLPNATDSAALPASLPSVTTPKPARHVSRLQLQTIDTASLATTLGDKAGNSPHMPVMQARATAMRPAPLPDEDVDAPGPDAQTLASQQQASLNPSFYSNKDHFSGDGFAPGSNLESDKNNRRRPGGGMSLSIPMP